MSALPNKRYILGGIFLLIGVLLILDNLNIFRFYIPDYFFGWYSILMIIGAVLIASRDKVGFGITLLAIGSVFMLNEMSYYYRWYFDFWDIFDFWPLVFIVLGLVLILRRNRDGDYNEKKRYDSDADYVDELSIFGGSDRVITSSDFKGGKLTSIFGGTDLNLVNARLASGTNVLDVFVLFGGTDIIVPPDMKVKVKVTAIFGGFSDERKIISDDIEDYDGELVIKGLVLFGGGEVK